jgi:hypothetical protein
MSRLNKVLLWVVGVLVVILLALLVWWNFSTGSSYYAVYLNTGDLYFGKLSQFPSFTLTNVYTIQATQDPDNPISLQKFSNVFWGPSDYLNINDDQVVWYTKLDDAGELVQLLNTNPDLIPQQNQQQVPQTAPAQ